MENAVWSDDARANRALLSGVFSQSTDGTRAGDKLLLLHEDHVRQLFEKVLPQQQQPSTQNASADPPSPPVKRAAKRGRPRVIDPVILRETVFKLMDQHGDFTPEDPEWNARARLEEAIRIELGIEPAPSTLAVAVPPYIEEWRSENSGK